MGISQAMTSGIQPGICTSTTRPAVPYEGQMIYETDTDRTLVWNSSAWIGVGKLDALQVNASGYVQTLVQPRFLAVRSGDLAGYNPSSQVNPVVMNSAVYNVGGAYSTSTGLFTAPVAGTYLFQAGVYQSGAVSQLWWVYNGTREKSFVLDVSTNSNVSGMGFLYLNAGDTVGFVSWSNGSVVTVYANGFHTYFRGALIG